MAKYEIWGADDTGATVLLGYNNGELPMVGDTLVARSQVREVEKVWRHHVGPQATQRVKVGQPLGAAEEGTPKAA